MKKNIRNVIARLEEVPKHGASYEHMGRKGWINPIREDEGPVLQALVLAKNPRRVLEIGTAFGLSLCHLALQASKDCKFVTIEWLEQNAVQAHINIDEAGIADRAEILVGDALQVIPTLKGWFDLVFLDANKDGYYEQFRLLEQYGVLGQGALVIADNVIDRQSECQNFLDYMAKYDPILLPVGKDADNEDGKPSGLLIAKV